MGPLLIHLKETEVLESDEAQDDEKENLDDQKVVQSHREAESEPLSVNRKEEEKEL